MEVVVYLLIGNLRHGVSLVISLIFQTLYQGLFINIYTCISMVCSFVILLYISGRRKMGCRFPCTLFQLFCSIHLISTGPEGVVIPKPSKEDLHPLVSTRLRNRTELRILKKFAKQLFEKSFKVYPTHNS